MTVLTPLSPSVRIANRTLATTIVDVCGDDRKRLIDEIALALDAATWLHRPERKMAPP